MSTPPTQPALRSPATRPHASPSGAEASERRERPRLLPIAAGVALIFFVAGCASAAFRWFPYTQFVEPGFVAARAVSRQLLTTSSVRHTDLWATPRFEQRGVLHHDPSQASAGYTLYTSGHDSAAFLIDMEGRLRHRWRAPFYEVWEQPRHVRRPVPEAFVHWRRAHLLPNGDLIAMYEAAGDTPWGYGMVKVDRDSNVIWKLAEHTHHDMCVRPDGVIVTLCHDWRDSRRNPAGEMQLPQALLDDFVLVVSPDGKVTQRISILDAFGRSDFQGMFTDVPDDQWDVLHTNTVELITPEFAAHHDFARPGQVMLSLRTCNALAILDLETKQIVWATRGPYVAQHDPDVTPEGRVLLFDNQGHAGHGGPSRVIEFDPVSQAIAWSYTGTAANPLYSRIRSTQQRLPNGNTLITESDAGRLLEVTSNHEVVWEFRNPARLPSESPSIAILCGATRWPASIISFPLNDGKLNRSPEAKETNP